MLTIYNGKTYIPFFVFISNMNGLREKPIGGFKWLREVVLVVSVVLSFPCG